MHTPQTHSSTHTQTVSVIHPSVVTETGPMVGESGADKLNLCCKKWRKRNEEAIPKVITHRKEMVLFNWTDENALHSSYLFMMISCLALKSDQSTLKNNSVIYFLCGSWKHVHVVFHLWCALLCQIPGVTDVTEKMRRMREEIHLLHAEIDAATYSEEGMHDCL